LKEWTSTEPSFSNLPPTRYREQLCLESSRFFRKLPGCLSFDHDIDD
jgi:hypothetical protein